MVLTALRGALGFLTRLPVGRDDRAWEAFRRTPVALPLAGYVVGFLAVLPLLLPLPPETVALLFVAWLPLATGITHLDGLADLGDALVVHGDAPARRAVMKDTTVGVGAVLSVAVVVLGLGLAGLALAGAPLRVLPLVVAAEVGAKLGLAAMAGFGTAAHEGLGSALSDPSTPRSLVGPALVAIPAALMTWPQPAAAAALAGSLVATAAVYRWATARLGGVSGDVYGAGNELARVVGLHAGVIAWTRF